MRKILYQAPWIVILLPFLILAILYNSLPDEILIYRNLFGSAETYSAKSLFTVFRVPLIELVCFLAVLIMRRRAAGADESEISRDYYLMWTILLYTVAFKSLFQAFEIISSGPAAAVFFYLTAGVVIAGIILALFTGRKVFLSPYRAGRKLALWEKLALLASIAAYITLAFVLV